MSSNYGRGGGAARGRGRGRGGSGGGRQGGGRGNQQNQGGGRGRGYNQSQSNQGGGRGWEAPHRGSYQQQPAPQQWVGRPPVQGNQPPAQQAWGYRPPQTQPTQQPVQQGVGRAGGSAWTGRPWGPSSSSSTPVQSVPSPKGPSKPSPGELGLQKLKISEVNAESSSADIKQDEIKAIRRPDSGGTVATRSVRLLVNHFKVNYDINKTIFHYDVDVKPVSEDNRVVRRTLKKPDMRVIRDRVFSEHQFPNLMSAYDGEKNIFSAVQLPTGQFKVEIPEGEEVRSGLYTFTIKCVNELTLSRLNDYIRGNHPYIPRNILQGMDLVMKDNPLRRRIMVGRSFYSNEYRREDDLLYGIAAYRGFQQSLKPTSRGLALCLDFSVLAFRKPLPVIDYLKEHVPAFKREGNNTDDLLSDVHDALKGLKVRVTHRRTKQKYVIAGLAERNACDSKFEFVDPEGNNPPREIRLIDYFREKWDRDIEFQNIPCLELGKPGKSNEVPMEFCVLVEGQRYPKEDLDKDTALLLKNLSLARPWDRRKSINEMVQSADGPCGDVMRNFGFGVDTNMTKVVGRVIGAPNLKIGAARSVRVDDEKCQWNLVGKSLLDAKSLQRWALLDFTNGERFRLQADAFVNNLMGRCRSLGIQMAEPLLHRATRMYDFSSVDRLEKLLRDVVEKCNKITQEKLQMIVCVMSQRDPGYRILKWVSETKIGVVTQCCLSSHANKGQDQYLANLCLKINAKLGGSNFELGKELPHFGGGDDVMFIGADVNHPGANNTSCPSIAAVVGTINWPAANRYAARVRPQAHRTEKIIDFGEMCVDLIKTYAQLNKVKPEKIVVFRDGVSEGQIKMVLSEEFLDLKKALQNYDSHYSPMITIVVAQKRHSTRLFPENRNDGSSSGNVPPGTVVDTDIIHPLDFDFYLCSHYGALGTSKPTHYYVLWDENFFSSDELQQLIYDMCFTFARCTKPVSLVPPVYYADLVAYRGRMFQEVVMETQSRGTSTASFNQSFYSLHPDLENIMFFV